MIKYISILGYRGFSKKREIQFAIPNGELGSGLTILVGDKQLGQNNDH